MTFDPHLVIPLRGRWRLGFYYVPLTDLGLGAPFNKLVGITKFYNDDSSLDVWQMIFFILEIRLFKFEEVPMGDWTEAILDGVFCQECGELIEDEHGYFPVSCFDCKQAAEYRRKKREVFKSLKKK